MNDDTKSKQLLAYSYAMSAHRVQQALDGVLSIGNSREPMHHPLNSGEVIGLCGQSGRHPYFRISRNVLESAVQQIERIMNEARMDPERAVETINIVCQELRQRTYFDVGNGCVNDQLPSMVPLLPPEEIWLGDREMPLDVWRLISFEFDLVSSAVASQIPFDDPSFSSHSQAVLAFRYMMGQLGDHTIRFGIVNEGMPPQFATLLGSSAEMEVSVARLFFEAGFLLTPLAEQAFTKWYPAFRYMHWLPKVEPDFRVRKEFQRESVDSRYRGIFAEEMAIGMMAIILGDTFQARPINNTVEVLPAGAAQPNDTIADFIAQARDPVSNAQLTIIAESKGSLGRLVSKNRRDHAKDQVAATNAVFAGTSTTLPLAFSSSIYFSGQKKVTHCIVADPPTNSESQRQQIDPVNAWRVAYAKSLRFAGLEVAARQILRGEPAEALRPIDRERQMDRKTDERDERRFYRADASRERYGVELVLDVGAWGVSIDSNVLEMLQHGIREGMEREFDGVLNKRRSIRSHEQRESSFATSLGVGCVYYADVERRDQNRRQ